MQSAVLFIVFNRPDTTRQVFEAIRAAKPPRLYVAADGPRADRQGERERCEEVRRIATAVDWDCEVKTLFREKNIGCKIGVSSGIDWFFENEGKGIILEDDCLPSQSFFLFCEEMLSFYQDDDQVMAVTGTNITKGLTFHGDYFFSKYSLMWGWATWANAWRQYDRKMLDWPAFERNNGLKNLRMGGLPFITTWTNILQRTYVGEIDTWDYQWIYTCLKNNGLTVAPSKNLISNLGFSEDATHTSGNDPILSHLQLNELTWPLKHATDCYSHLAADKFISKYWFHISWLALIKKMLISIPAIKVINYYRKKFFYSWGRLQNSLKKRE